MNQLVEESYQNAQKNHEKKALVYYEHLLDSLIITRMEYDKSLLLISIGGVGLLITLLTTLKFPSIYYILFFIISILALLITGIMIAYTFYISTTYIKFILANQNKKAEKENKKLKLLRWIIVFSFTSGIAFAVGVGILAAVYKL